MKAIILIALGLGLLLAIRELWIIIKRSVKALRLKRIRNRIYLDGTDQVNEKAEKGSFDNPYSSIKEALDNLTGTDRTMYVKPKNHGLVTIKENPMWNSFTGYTSEKEQIEETKERC